MSSSRRSIFLIGFMASGKSAVGQILAERAGIPFVDLDQWIAKAAGATVAEVFASEGETGFRAREQAALAEVLAGPAVVVATGGGAPCFADNLARMRAAGLVVALTADLSESLDRAAQSAEVRPLLEQPIADIEALYQARLPVYRQAHASVATGGRDPGAVAADVEAIARSIGWIDRELLEEASIVAPADQPAYPVLVSSGSLDRVGELTRSALPRARTIGVISDSNVAPLYAARMKRSLEAAGFDVVEVMVTAGESSKSFAVFERTCIAMVKAGLDRSSAIVALGGGVVGDVAGFVAATLYRGVPVVQVPTTILAMVDSAIGGKTGINIPEGKNLVGAFWQPRMVLADPEVLMTLPVRERRAAFGEMVKYGLLDGESLYAEIDALAPSVGAGGTAAERPGALREALRRCAAIKAGIVTRDALERGERALLNLGHTMGHAIEAATGYAQYLHGEAVGLGLIASCRVSERLGMCDAALEERASATIARAGLDNRIDPWLIPDVIERIGVDKKRTGSSIRFVALRGVGEPELVDLELDELRRILPARSVV